jgi:hypothetical protein
MDKETSAALKHLHEQLQQVRDINHVDRDLIRQLQADIDSILASEKPQPSSVRSITQQLQDAVERFEATHPDLTMIMARVIKQLSDLGI